MTDHQIDAEAVEKAADALWDATSPERSEYLAIARAALSAAYPAMRAQIIRELLEEADRECARLFESGANTDRDLRLMNERLRARDWLNDHLDQEETR